jgi:hypothetical protein
VYPNRRNTDPPGAHSQSKFLFYSILFFFLIKSPLCGKDSAAKFKIEDYQLQSQLISRNNTAIRITKE